MSGSPLFLPYGAEVIATRKTHRDAVLANQSFLLCRGVEKLLAARCLFFPPVFFVFPMFRIHHRETKKDASYDAHLLLLVPSAEESLPPGCFSGSA